MQTGPVEVSDGKYRWRYEMSLYKNPTIFLATAKAILIALGITLLIIGLINLIADGFSAEGFAFIGKLALILCGIFAVLLVLGYLLYAAVMGGSYIADFEMDEKKLVHRQSAKQAEKAETIGLLTVLMGLFTHNRGAASAGMAASAKSESVTELGEVKKVVVNKKRSVIRLRYFGWNDVYADGDDFDFVLSWLRAHVPETAEWIVKE